MSQAALEDIRKKMKDEIGIGIARERLEIEKQIMGMKA